MSKLTFEQRLAAEGKLIHTNVGDSMMPFLREGQDLMIIEPRPQGRCKRLDAVLYRRPNGKYVMHRIVKVRKHDYVLCGDNRVVREFGVQEDWIFGILTGIIRDGKTVPVTDRRYRLRVHLLCDFFWIRVLVIRTGRLFRKIKRKFKK